MTAPAAGGGDTRDGRALPRVGAGSRIHVIGPDTDYEVVGLDTWDGWAAGSLRLRGTPEHCRCTVPARPAAAPADDTGELREQAARWLAFMYGGEEYADQTGSNSHWREMADEFLALPAVRALIDGRRTDRARVAAVEALAEEWSKAWQPAWREPLRQLRRALGGER